LTPFFEDLHEAYGISEVDLEVANPKISEMQRENIDLRMELEGLQALKVVPLSR
jgi:hypothetical protein